MPARRMLALGGLRLVEALPGGALLVDFLGDMKPDPSLSIAPYGKALASPIGLSSSAISSLGTFYHSPCRESYSSSRWPWPPASS